MSSSKRLLSDVYETHTLLLLLALALFLGNCNAQTSPICVRPSSSCGNIPIRHPFRLKSDPENCGIKKYELECERNRLVLNLFHPARYYVHAINYDNYTIRVVDVGLQRGNCSSRPLYSISYDSYGNFLNGETYSLTADLYYSTIINIPYEIAEALWLSCEKPVKRHPLYTDGKTSPSSCIAKPTPPPSSLSSGEKRPYSYFLFGASLSASDVADHCKLDEIVMITLRLPADKSEANISFSDFHSKLEYGFELYWLSFLCEQCQGPGEYCSIESLNPSNVNCYKHCDGFWFSDSFPCARHVEILYNGVLCLFFFMPF